MNERKHSLAALAAADKIKVEHAILMHSLKSILNPDKRTRLHAKFLMEVAAIVDAAIAEAVRNAA